MSSALPDRDPDTDPPWGNFPRRFQACRHKVWVPRNLGRAGFGRAPTSTPLPAGALLRRHFRAAPWAAQELQC